MGLWGLPLWIGVSLGLAVGSGLAMASLMSRYRDVQHVLPMLIPFLMYATPVAYPLEGVPDSLRWLYVYNPMSWVVEGGRAAFFGGEPRVGVAWVGYALGSALLAMGLGWWSFRRMERTLADVL